jgi:phosphoglucosamine mutase
MKRLFFGTDGIRGAYGGDVVNEAFFARIGMAAAHWLGARGVRGGKVVIGRDTRHSGASLARAVGAGLNAGGARAVSLGIVPTPAVSRASRLDRAALGAVITASHNPACDNGVKFFGSDGSKLTDAEEAEIESLLPPAGGAPSGAAGELPGESALEAYIADAARILPPGSLRGWRVALDTANGATCASSPAVFAALGAEVSCVGNRPDGRNINAGVGSEHPEALAALVLSSGARLGAAHDGDGDRCVMCDEKGQLLDGDELLAILATHALARGTLARNTLVVTVQSNLGVDLAVGGRGWPGRPDRCRRPLRRGEDARTRRLPRGRVLGAHPELRIQPDGRRPCGGPEDRRGHGRDGPPALGAAQGAQEMSPAIRHARGCARSGRSSRLPASAAP